MISRRFFLFFWFFQQDGKPRVEKKQAEGPAQSTAVERCCEKGGGKGAGRSKKEAEQMAAKDALEKLTDQR